MLEQVKAARPEATLSENSTPTVIFNYFAGEKLWRMDRKSQKFLLKTALMPDGSVDMAIELTGIKEGGRILSG